MADLALINAGELVTCAGSGDTGPERLGIVRDGALLVEGGRVTWVGSTREFESKSIEKPKRVIDAEGGLVTPGFVDPHTHAVFAGSREDELERKALGESYTSILASGGGIMRTIRETRAAPLEKIVSESRGRLVQLMRNGVTTAEVKTGYGQRLEDEMKSLDAIGRLSRECDVELVPTFLGLHAKPPEFRTPGEYVDYAIKEMLPVAARAKMRAAFSDCFCEEGVFSREECSRYLKASKELGFALKIHADEFADSGGASLGAELRCVSADHLGRSSPEGMEALGRAGVKTVLLPGTSLSSGIPYADAGRLALAGCEIALGTDLSPNSWIESPQMVMSLACSGMRMTPAQALLGCTRSAASAVSRADLGTLAPGAMADFVVFSFPNYRFLPYRVGGGYVRRVVKRGKEAYRRTDD